MTLVERFRRRTRHWWAACTRTKIAKVQRSNSEQEVSEEGVLMPRFLELVNVSLASTLPVGIFVLAGVTVKNITGPSGIISAILAAIFAGLVGVSWFELSSKSWRFFQRGSYEYAYRTGSEVSAFLTGWILILHHSSWSALSSRAVSENFDMILNNRLSNYSLTKFGRIQPLNSQLDLIGFLLSLLSMTLCATNVSLPHQRSCRVVSNCLLFAGVIFVCVVALYHLDFSNWAGAEKFFPHKAKGVFSGTAMTYFLFGISDSAVRWRDSSARTRRRSLIASSLTSSVITVLMLISVTSIMTLLVRHSPWSTDCPLAESFGSAGVAWVKYLVSALSLTLILPSMCGQLRRMVDITAEIAHDGLLMKFFRKSNGLDDVTTPSVWTYVVFGTLTSLGAMLLDLTLTSQLVSVTTICVHLIAVYHSTVDRFRPMTDRRKSAKRRVPVERRSVSTHTDNEANGHRRTDGCYGTTTMVNPSCSGPMDSSQYGRVDRPPETNGHGPDHVRQGHGVIQESDPVVVESRRLQQQQQQQQWLPGIDTDIELTDDEELASSSSDTDIDEIVDEFHQTAHRDGLSRPPRHTQDDSLIDIRCPTIATWNRSLRLIRIYVTSCFVFAVSVGHLAENLVSNQAIICVLSVPCCVVGFVCFVLLFRLPRNEPGMSLFRCPDWIRTSVSLTAILVLCCLVNLFHGSVTVLVLIWISLGCFLYCVYGMKHSQVALIQMATALPEEEQGLLDRSSESNRENHHTPVENDMHFPI